MDGLNKNLVEPARSEEDLPVSAVTEVPLSEIVQTRVQTFIRLQNRKTKYENRGTCPRFSCICAVHAISCALPRGSVSIVKTDFLNKLKRSANALRFTFDFRKAVYNSMYRYRAARTQGKPLQHK